ncbi:FMN-binding negative transcriptional regulator [Qipengyuania sp. 6B39]|uniref:FMN-binding negative transcriptional regulator n=1 Tax=Qipengyuania proteolytica TaxID=2867239 RepID=UPI001C8AF6F7|nr:FMN-binding negative transcriptional regulator [Qipengyuania proteolytica]MBX7496723.1 FMN-binding negative transcriptional regulator [Qipengyuania proteolytica]
MHPNPLFRSEDRALLEGLLDEIGFGMVFLTTPDGPRVAHTPLLSMGDGRVRFHLSRGNALTPHLAGARALITVNGPHGYVSPRWYAERDTVPTWDYVALEMEGTVEPMPGAELEAFLHAVIAKFEGRLGGEQWLASESSEATWSRLFRGIGGFEMQVENWRPTLKLSQKKAGAEHAAIVAGISQAGNPELARWMRQVAA